MYWINGIASESAHVQFDLSDRGLLLGDGIFDTALVLNGHVVFGAAHLARLRASLEELDIKADLDEIARIHDLAREAAAPAQTLALRITVTRGGGPRGLLPPVPQFPTLFASLVSANRELFFAPLSLYVSSIRRNETSPCARQKTLSYLDGIFANRQAAKEGFDEALFLNGRGSVACAATANIFAIFDKKIVTPSLSEGCLPGIIRAAILDLAAEADFTISESSLDLAYLLQADVVFLTNSLRLMAPVMQIGLVKLPPERSPQFKILQKSLWRKIMLDCSLAEKDAGHPRFLED